MELTKEAFEHMIGTERVDVRPEVTLKYRVDGVKYHSGGRFGTPSVIVYGRCIEDRAIAGRSDVTWFGAYCAEVFYSVPAEDTVEETPEEHTMKVTPEMIQALAWLRKGWNGDNSEAAIKALETLDNAGVFASIDEATGYDTDPEDRTPNGLDPAEWGDMAFGPRG